jgi:hypothetical protein
MKAAVGLPLCHETHRGGLFDTPFRTSRLLDAAPDTKLHTDLCAWCCGCGRLFNEEKGDDFWPLLLERVARASMLISGHMNDGTEPQTSVRKWILLLLVRELDRTLVSGGRTMLRCTVSLALVAHFCWRNVCVRGSFILQIPSARPLQPRNGRNVSVLFRGP